MNSLLDSTAVLSDLIERIANATINIQVNQYASVRDLARAGNKAPTISLVMSEHAELKVPGPLLRDINRKHGSIEHARPIKIMHRNVKPDDAVVFAVVI